MNHLIQQYLRNYLAKKSLVAAAEREVKEAHDHVATMRAYVGLLPPDRLDAALKRRRYAEVMLDQLRDEETQAYDAYMTNLHGHV